MLAAVETGYGLGEIGSRVDDAHGDVPVPAGIGLSLVVHAVVDRHGRRIACVVGTEAPDEGGPRGGEGGGGVVSASDKVTIRGFDARSNIYVDGIRDIAGYSRDTFNYEAVEVIKGGSGSLDGRSTGGGSVNLATKRARLEDFGAVSGRYDSFENARVTLDYNKKLSENVAGRLNLLYSDGGDFFDNGVEEYQTTGVAGSLLYKVNEATDINLDVFVMEQDNQVHPHTLSQWRHEEVVHIQHNYDPSPNQCLQYKNIHRYLLCQKPT